MTAWVMFDLESTEASLFISDRATEHLITEHPTANRSARVPGVKNSDYRTELHRA